MATGEDSQTVSRWFWLSSAKMTVGVETNDGLRIITAPPIVRKFIGQPVKRLADWMRRQPGPFIGKEL